MKSSQTWNYVKLEVGSNIYQIHCLASRTYLIIIGPNSHEKITNIEIRSN